ncbi:SIR2 family protein [Yersinia enterocolitica]
MTDEKTRDIYTQVEDHLKCTEQNWLMGAGISYDANLPLMYPLTNKVLVCIKNGNIGLYNKIIEPIINELPKKSHIEHILSHLGDYAALAERNLSKSVKINGNLIERIELENIHRDILQCISNTIRSGYIEDEHGNLKQEGTPDNPIVSIDTHLDFIDSLFNHSQSGIHERRKPVNIFTTNYDTLLEDSLALKKIPYWDGFSGGAVAYRTLNYGDNLPSNGVRANIIKVHGSIDWYLCENGYVWRVRENDGYPTKNRRVLIYPQATKYIATQQDPFSTQFDIFRRSLNSPNSNVLSVCGYSFGDEHINNEIEVAMSKKDNKTVLLAFVECRDEIPTCLEKWRNSHFGERIIIITINGVYIASDGPYSRTANDYIWTFKGVTKILKNGCEV